MSEGSPLWGAGNVRPKRQRVEQNFTKSSLNCIHNAGSWARLYHQPDCSNRVYAISLLVQSWRGYPPSSCTSRIPKQHPLDPPVRGRIRNMHRKFPGMFEALFRPSVQSMLLCECHCLSIGWCEHHKVFSSQTNLQARREKEMKTKQLSKYCEVKPVCAQAALKGTGENKKNKATLCTLQCPSDRLLHVWTQKVTKCGIKFDHRFPSRATSNQMPKCWYLPNFWIILSQVFRGRPVPWCPLQVQVGMRASQRSGGRFAA